MVNGSSATLGRCLLEGYLLTLMKMRSQQASGGLDLWLWIGHIKQKVNLTFHQKVIYLSLAMQV
ncbi:hypothetical protein AB205_0020500, partial [Aquarana catesbeiana]